MKMKMKVKDSGGHPSSGKECSSEEDLEKLIDHQGLYLAEKPYKCDMRKALQPEFTVQHYQRIHTGESPTNASVREKLCTPLHK